MENELEEDRLRKERLLIDDRNKYDSDYRNRRVLDNVER
jgi:hypothetical protein